MENDFCQVFISSGSPSDLNVPNSSIIEAPLTISLPRSYTDGVQFENVDPACSVKGAIITVPVSVQRQPVLAPPSAEGLNTNGPTYGNNASRRKRKPWSEAEDLELMAAVKKCGEGNWANIIRGDFLSDRTASQLSQRWAIIKKKHGNLNVGVNTAGTQLSEVQLAARHAMSVALGRHVGSLKARINGSASTSTIGNGSSLTTVATSEQVQDKLHQSPTHAKPSSIGSSSLTAKTQVTTSKKMVPKSSFDSDCIVRAAAVAAGARIASPADAASLLKAAQSKNAIHIMAKVPASTKTLTPGRGPSHLEAHPSIKLPTLSTTPTVVPSRGGPLKITSPTTAKLSSVQTDQNTAVASATASTASATDQNTAVASTASADSLSEKEIKIAEEIRGRSLAGVQATSQKGEHCLSKQSLSGRVQQEKPADLGPPFKRQSSGRVQEEKPAELGPPLKRQATETSNCSSSSQNMPMADGNTKVETCNQAEERQKSNANMVTGSSDQQGIMNQSQVERAEPQDMDINSDGKDRPITKTDRCSENSRHKEAASEILEGNTKVDG
ncbi:cell wall protein DAN4 isoform X2 [Cucumis sativus]|uniref:cell wall protein DAN4 isoform X2 n=1 Tax=Cucumis sativus TaxID=3659 RepID=UPI0005EBF4B6|nr:cell wall protein DAN4 isoform X2 [Cucumis sativus]